MISKVYFTSNISSSELIEIFKHLSKDLKGKIAVKVHSGEPGGNNFLKPEFMKDLVNYVNGTIVECNTAYEGQRNTTEKHIKTIMEHGFYDIAPVDILDSECDVALSIDYGKHLKANYVGSHLLNYDGLLVLSHFKGHQMGGFGGALKNISIGLASSFGKAYIHGAGNPDDFWTANQDSFLESMAEASKSILDLKKDNIVFINVMCNLSIDCDCDSNPHTPEMADIGILASLDPVALDQACLDLIYNSKDVGKKSLINRIESKNGKHIIEVAEQLGCGSSKYELININS